VRVPNAMTEQRWTTDELDRIGEADELQIAPVRLAPRSEAGA
jgi:hypothetical protein